MTTPLLILVFVVMMVMCFGVFALSLRARPEQTALGDRLHTLVSRHTASAEHAQLLVLRPPKQSDAWQQVDGFFQKARIVGQLQLLMRQGRVSSTVPSVLLTCAGLGAAAFAIVLFVTSNPWIAAGAALCFAYGPIARLRMRRARYLKAFEAVLPDAIELCARSLRAGHSLVASISNIADEGPEPVKSEFAEVFRLQNFGLPIRDALTQLMDRVPSADLRVVVTGILVQKDTGGNLAEIMDHISEVIRERVRIKGDIQVHTAQGRLTGWILCLLPVILLLIINVVSPGYSSLLFHDPTGQKLLYGSLALLLIGGFIIRNIVTGIEV